MVAMTAREANMVMIQAMVQAGIPRSELQALRELTTLATDVLGEANAAGDFPAGASEALIGLAMKAWLGGRAYGKEHG